MIWVGQSCTPATWKSNFGAGEDRVAWARKGALEKARSLNFLKVEPASWVGPRGLLGWVGRGPGQVDKWERIQAALGPTFPQA